MTIATVPIVTLAKPAKLTIARNTREFSVGVSTVIRIVESTDLRRTWAAGTGRTSCGRCQGPSTIGRSSRGPPAIAGTLDISLSSVLQLSPGLWMSAWPYYPYHWMTVWVRRDAPAIADRPFQVRRNAPAIADWPSPPRLPTPDLLLFLPTPLLLLSALSLSG